MNCRGSVRSKGSFHFAFYLFLCNRAVYILQMGSQKTCSGCAASLSKMSRDHEHDIGKIESSIQLQETNKTTKPEFYDLANFYGIPLRFCLARCGAGSRIVTTNDAGFLQSRARILWPKII